MEIKPIRNEQDYAAALAEIDRLLAKTRDDEEEDDLEVLSLLVEKYEEMTDPIGTPDPVDAIVFHMDQTGKAQTDLAMLLGSRSRASEILGRRRRLTIEMVRLLNEAWKIPLASLIHEPRGRTKKSRVVVGSKVKDAIRKAGFRTGKKEVSPAHRRGRKRD